jgi:hypothetical protein
MLKTMINAAAAIAALAPLLARAKPGLGLASRSGRGD